MLRTTVMTGLAGILFPFMLSAAPSVPPSYPPTSLHTPGRFFPLAMRAPVVQALPVHHTAASAPEVLPADNLSPDEVSNLPIGMTREQAEQIISLFATPN